MPEIVRWFRSIAVVIGLLALRPAPVFAQDIVQLNEDGISAFKEGRFEDAASKFNQAYAIKPEPPLKKNEALAWFKAGKCEQALSAAKEYLAMGVDDKRSTLEAQKVLVGCHVRHAEAHIADGNLDGADAELMQARAGIPAPEPDSEAPFPEDAKKIAELEVELQAKRDAVAIERQAAVEQAEAEKARQDKLKQDKNAQTIGLGLMGGGGAIVLGALIYHIALATGTSSKFNDAAASGDQDSYDRLGKKLETGNWLVPTLYVVGLATAGVGVYLWWDAGGLEKAPQTAKLGGLESIGVTTTWRF